MKLFKRILTLICAFVISFSILLVPASAVEPKQVGMTFWDWLTYLIEKGDSAASSFGGGAGRTAAAYAAKVRQITDVLGTSTVGNNCIYLGNWSTRVFSDIAERPFINNHYTFDSGATFKYSGSNSSDSISDYEVRNSTSFATDSTLDIGNLILLLAACVAGAKVFWFLLNV